jgi:two-component system sensor histidine kinase PilS (NtrC family)
MQEAAPAHSWFGPTLLDTTPDTPEDPRELARLWRGFMTARLTLGLVLVVLQLALYITGTAHNQWLIAVSTAYFAGTVATRILASPKPLGTAFNRNWLMLVGLDVLTFASLQWMQGNNLNYTPLFALPILLASVLGSLRMALGTAAGITMLLLGGTLWNYLGSPTDATPYFVQAALSGVGYFAVALLANQLSTRLADEGQRARRSQVAARIQRQVNELVIESLPDGVLIVDSAGSVRAANPAARQLMGSRQALHKTAFDLREEPGWRPLLDLTRMSVGTGHSQEADVTIRHEGHGPRRLRARTRLAAPQGTDGESLCVLFLQDLRELEARMRTEKLASMGRMSTAVAHEIRNPLAAIAQANALLDEDLSDPRLKRLTGMVSQNAKRLEKIVEDILNVSRVQPLEDMHAAPVVSINESVHRICNDWAGQNGAQQQLVTQLPDAESTVAFDADHLRRVLINLLDNARRYASAQPGAIQVGVRTTASRQVRLTIWSDGAPMDRSVERHLFEPFFSSESRSSGLGLYICRELCESHGATIFYQRNVRQTRGEALEGNEFVIGFANTTDTHTSNINTTPWQTTLY